MPGIPLVTTNASLVCTHGGHVTIAPRPGRLTATAGTVLCEGDLVGAPIVGCTQAPSTNTKPCTSIVSVLPGGSNPRVLVGGRPAHHAGLVGVTDGVPPGQVKVVSPGQARITA